MDDSCTSSIHITIKDNREPNEEALNQFSYSMFVDKKNPLRDSCSSSDDTDAPGINKQVAPQHIMEWVDDSKATHCYSCNSEFSLFIRRHHCRYCGKIFCHNCSSKNIHIPKYLKKFNTDDKNWRFINFLKMKTLNVKECATYAMTLYLIKVRYID